MKIEKLLSEYLDWGRKDAKKKNEGKSEYNEIHLRQLKKASGRRAFDLFNSFEHRVEFTPTVDGFLKWISDNKKL